MRKKKQKFICNTMTLRNFRKEADVLGVLGVSWLKNIKTGNP